MNINLTILGQAISFAFFVLFCMKYVWPPLTSILRERREAIIEGLEKAAQAEKELEKANDAAGQELEQAKKQSAELISQARSRASQLEEEAARIIAGAQGQIDQEVSRAREELRAKVGALAVQGAEKILGAAVDRSAHENMLKKLAEEL